MPFVTPTAASRSFVQHASVTSTNVPKRQTPEKNRQRSSSRSDRSSNGFPVRSGTNTYTGGTDVQNGRLIVANAYGLKDGTSLTVGDAGLFAPVIPSHSPIAPVPEPGTLALLLVAGILSAAVYRRCRQAKAYGGRCRCRASNEI